MLYDLSFSVFSSVKAITSICLHAVYSILYGVHCHCLMGIMFLNNERRRVSGRPTSFTVDAASCVHVF